MRRAASLSALRPGLTPLPAPEASGTEAPCQILGQRQTHSKVILWQEGRGREAPLHVAIEGPRILNFHPLSRTLGLEVEAWLP